VSAAGKRGRCGVEFGVVSIEPGWTPYRWGGCPRGANRGWISRLLLDHGADPNAGDLWHGLLTPFTALTAALGNGEGNQPAHPHALALASVVLDAGAGANDGQVLYAYDHRDCRVGRRRYTPPPAQKIDPAYLPADR
jgi:hypothetical protein